MKDVALDPECRHFARRYLLAERIRAGVKRRRHDEPASRRRVADEADDGLERSKRLASPIDRDEREESVLDLVPLAGPWRIVADVDDQLKLVGESLQLGFPHARAVPVAASGIGGDEELASPGIARRTHSQPPR